MTPVYRAPMRSRTLDLPQGPGADYGLALGLVGIGDQPGEKAARLLAAFAAVPDGAFVWTRSSDGRFHLGRLAGRCRRDSSPAAREVGIVHVRPVEWLERPFGPDEVPVAVAATFARGGLNFQRTHDEAAERRSCELWKLARASTGYAGRMESTEQAPDQPTPDENESGGAPEPATLPSDEPGDGDADAREGDDEHDESEATDE